MTQGEDGETGEVVAPPDQNETVAYVVYELETGEIVRSGNAPRFLVALQAGEGQGVIEGVCDDENQLIIDGVACAKEPKC